MFDKDTYKADFDLADFEGKSSKKIDVEFEFKAINDDGSFSGYAARYDSVDLGNDKIEPFAAAKSLKSSKGKIPILRNHSARMEDLVGENKAAIEDDKGLKVDGQFNLDTDSGMDTYKKVKFAKESGRKMGLSIGFIPNYKKIDYIDGVRILKEIHVVEYSVVIFPMQPTAKISSIKSFCEDATSEEIAHKKREFETALRDVGASQKERKAAVEAIFTLREVDKEAEMKAEEEKQNAEFAEMLIEAANRIKK